MLKKFALWFICFGLSFLVESIGWTEQGRAFLFIDLGANGLILIIACLFAVDSFGERIGHSVIGAVHCGVEIVVILFATWVATKLFNVDYYVTFQIMTFVQCLCSLGKKKD